MNTTSYQMQFHIDADHPSLPGHFPGRALVPGVLLLEQVALALKAWRGQQLRRIDDAKFLVPLLPGQQVDLHLTDTAGKLRFDMRRGEVSIARGTIEGAA